MFKVSYELSEQSKIKRGVRQGWQISQMSFNVYTDIVMTEALHGMDDGGKIGGKLVQANRFADDQAISANT